MYVERQNAVRLREIRTFQAYRVRCTVAMIKKPTKNTYILDRIEEK